MPNLPHKLQSGMPFRPSVITTINNVIDYLKTQRLVSDNRTIRINQLTSGIAISAVQQNNNIIDIPDDIYPFKLSIGYNEDLQSNVLNIHKGRIALNGDDESRIYVCFQANDQGFDEYIPLPEQEGLYNVELLIFYDENTVSPNQDFWQIRVVYKQPSSTLNWVDSVGFFSIYLGDVSVVENSDGSLSYSVSNQIIKSGFSVYDCGITDHFQAYFTLSDYPDNGDVLEDNLVPDGITINGGNIYIQNELFEIQTATFNLTANDPDLYLIGIDSLSKIAYFKRIAYNSYRFTTDDRYYDVPICRVIQNGASLYGLQQYINNDFNFTIENNKVLLNSSDELPGYLQNKHYFKHLDFESMDEEKKQFYTGTNNSYILGVRHSSESSFSNSSFSSALTKLDIHDQLFWDYRGINSYNDDNSGTNFQTIVNANNLLKWDDYGKVRVNSSDSTPNFLDNKIEAGQNIYKSVIGNSTLKIWTRKVKEGHNINLVQGYEGGLTQLPYTQVNGYKTNISTQNGIKDTVTTSADGYTKSHVMQVDYPNFALTVGNGLTLTKSSSGMSLSTSSYADGVLIVQNGDITSVPAPSTNAVLGFFNNSYNWIPITTCDDSSPSSSSSNSESSL